VWNLLVRLPLQTHVQGLTPIFFEIGISFDIILGSMRKIITIRVLLGEIVQASSIEKDPGR
jgi:hypothetical protein